MKLTQGPMGEAATRKWATQTLQTIADHWHFHKAKDPELSGAQCTYLIEVQRAAEKYLRYCDDLESDRLSGLYR